MQEAVHNSGYEYLPVMLQYKKPRLNFLPHQPFNDRFALRAASVVSRGVDTTQGFGFTPLHESSYSISALTSQEGLVICLH